MADIAAPDNLSRWALPPPAARTRGEPIRVFDSAEAAIAFLARQVGNMDYPERRTARRLFSKPVVSH